MGKGHLCRGSGTWEKELVNEDPKVSRNGHEPQTVHTLSVKLGLMSKVLTSRVIQSQRQLNLAKPCFSIEPYKG